MKEAPLSAVIPVRNDLDGLTATLDALHRQTFRPAQVVVVWDQPDAFPDRAPFASSAIQWVRGPMRGSYAARNEGARHVTQPWIWFIDAGITFAPSFIEEALPYQAHYQYLAFPVYATLPRSLFEHYTAAYEFRFAEWFRRYHFGGAPIMVERATFERLGGFEESLFSGADHEFGRRCYEKGIRQGFIPHLPLYHPPRGWVAWVRKSIRVEQGKQQLRRRWPHRFGFYASPLRGWWHANVHLVNALVGRATPPPSRMPLGPFQRWVVGVGAALADWIAKTMVLVKPRTQWNI